MAEDSGNTIPVRIDTAGLEADVIKVREIFAELFNSLKTYSSQTIAPVAVSGLTELNASIKATNQSLAALTAQLEKLSRMPAPGGGRAGAQAVTVQDEAYRQWAITLEKIFTAQAKLIVQQQEEAKTLATLNVQIKENDKALKQDANTIAKIISLEEQLANTTSTETQRITELKVAIAEKNRILKESAQAANPDVQARLKALADEKAAADAAKQQAAQAAQAAKAQSAAQKTAAQQQVTAQKQLAQANRDADKQLQQSAKDALSQAAAFDRLKERVKSLKNEYYLLIQSQQASGKTFKEAEATPLAKAKLDELSVAQRDLNKLTEEFGEAGKGSFGKWGKGLTEIFSNIRQLAYILPGIGIAGIFNLAFEAIGKVLEQLDLFSTKVERNIELQKVLAEYMQKANEIIGEQAELFREAGQGDIKYYENQLKLQQASGVPYEKQLQQIDDLNKAKKKGAEDYVEKLSEQYHIEKDQLYNEVGKLRGQEIVQNEKRQSIVDNLIKSEKNLADKKNETIGLTSGIATRAIIKAGEVAGLESTRDFFKKQLEMHDQQASALNVKYRQLSGALKDSEDANTAIQDEAIKRQKYFADESIAITADSARQIYETSRIYWEKILNERTSTQEQQIEAIKHLYELDIQNAKNHYNEIDKNTSTTNDQRKEAQVNLAVSLVAIDDKKNHQISDNQMNWDLRRLEALKKIAQDELEIDSRKNQAIFQDNQNSLNLRLNALYNYSNDQKAILIKNRELFLASEKYRNLEPVEKRAEDVSFQKQIGEIDFTQIGRVREAVSSFMNERIRLLKEMNAEVSKSTDVEEQYISALTEINKSYLEGNLNLKDFEEARKSTGESQTLAFDTSKIESAKAVITNIQDEIGQNQLRIESAALSMTMRNAKVDEDAQKAAKARYDEVVAGGDKLKALLTTANEDLKKAELKQVQDQAAIQEARDKRDEAARKQIKANWEKVGLETVDLFGEIMDGMYEKRIEQVQRNIELIDKQYEHEIAAIEKSSLAEKDKTALTIQLQAQETRANEEADKKIRRLKHNQAILDKATAMAKIVWDTQAAIMNALKEAPAHLAIPLAISYGVLGAISLAKVAATPIPALALGTEDWRGGRALIGEAGQELVREPHKQPYTIGHAQVTYLPKHTEVVPLYSIPTIQERRRDNGWERTKYLASIIQKGNKTTTTKLINHVHVDAEWLIYKQRILYGNHT